MATRRITALLALLTMAGALPYGAAASGPAPSAEVSAERRLLTGSVTYLPRIALPPDAEIVVEATAADGTRARAVQPSAGRQVPLPFTIEVLAGRELTLRAAIRAGDELRWLSDGVAVPAGSATTDLGALMLRPHRPARMTSVLRCGGIVLEVGFLRDRARLRAGVDRDAPRAAPALDGVLDLAGQAAGPGRRFGTADGATWIWRRDEGFAVQINGTPLPDCVVAPAPLSLPVTARGNEPFWSIAIDAERMVFTRMDGAGATAETPVPQATGPGWRYAPFGADLAVTLRPGRCRDTMTGMPHPAAAEVEAGGQVLAGCAGAPHDLLAGPAWTVFEIEGQAVATGITATIEFAVAGSRVHGTSGCNRYAGAFSMTGEGLSFAAPMASSMMACEDPQMAVERRFLDALAGVDRFDLTDDGHLVLLRADRPAIRARR